MWGGARKGGRGGGGGGGGGRSSYNMIKCWVGPARGDCGHLKSEVSAQSHTIKFAS